ncbi:hypothetical protein LCGC14_1458740 [marine sediment metagenome]|uniref:Uncharacterized protein n=1 Tax=marine sediment metagenome TaxID=412755 RepID=A0A0F9K1U3_9ZZZZ
MSQFDRAESTRQRDDGIARAALYAVRPWKEHAMDLCWSAVIRKHRSARLPPTTF